MNEHRISIFCSKDLYNNAKILCYKFLIQPILILAALYDAIWCRHYSKDVLIRGNFTKRVSNHCLGLLNEETKISRVALATKIDKKNSLIYHSIYLNLQYYDRTKIYKLHILRIVYLNRISLIQNSDTRSFKKVFLHPLPLRTKE